MATAPRVEVTFTPEGSGWASCELVIGSVRHTIQSVSDTTDPLGDLVRAALVIVAGAPKATASFDSEPIETRWLLETSWFEQNHWESGFRVSLNMFADFYANQPDELGERVFSVLTSKVAFANAILKEADRLLTPVNASWLTGEVAPALPVAVEALRTALACDLAG